MLNAEEIYQLNKAREYYYTIDWSYGEVFDSNFMDAFTDPGITFKECLDSAKEDTETYLAALNMAGTPSQVQPYDA